MNDQRIRPAGFFLVIARVDGCLRYTVAIYDTSLFTLASKDPTVIVHHAYVRTDDNH